MREKWIGREIDLVVEQDMNRRVRRGLLIVAKAHELAELDADPQSKEHFTGFTSFIDARGTMFIHLANDGMIRDMSKEIEFTAHDNETKRPPYY